MQMIGLPDAGEENNWASRMSAEPMVEGTSKSLAVECARLCSDNARSNDVKSEGKYQKRDSEAKMKQGHYHIQENSDVSFLAILKNFRGWDPGKQDDSQRIVIHVQYSSQSQPWHRQDFPTANPLHVHCLC
jgi:hypothetical protein